MTVILALPAYNEERGLPLVLGAFLKQMAAAGLSGRAVVVDDGSRDGTPRAIREAAAEFDVRSLTHEVNRGLGETIRDALRLAAATADPDDIVVSMDSDNTHSPELIPAMVARIGEGYDVVIASRYRGGSAVVGLAPFRHVMSWGARAMFQLVFPIRGVRDYTCGFRAYRAAVLQRAFAHYGDALVTERSFASMAEILVRIARLGVRFSEVPMVLRYDLKGGASKMNVGRTVARTLGLMLRLRFKTG